MNKRFLLFFSFLLFFAFSVQNNAYAKTRIGLIVYTERFELGEKVEKELLQNIKELFPAGNYQIAQSDSLKEDFVQAFANKVIKDPELTTKRTLLDLAKKYKYDCILLLYYDLDKAANNNNFLDWQKNAQITLKARLLQEKKAKYIYVSDITRNTGTPIHKLKDLSTVADVASLCAEKCNEYLFSILELPAAKRTLELS